METFKLILFVLLDLFFIALRKYFDPSTILFLALFMAIILLEAVEINQDPEPEIDPIDANFHREGGN